jgi:hypothetical protein
MTGDLTLEEQAFLCNLAISDRYKFGRKILIDGDYLRPSIDARTKLYRQLVNKGYFMIDCDGLRFAATGKLLNLFKEYEKLGEL